MALMINFMNYAIEILLFLYFSFSIFIKEFKYILISVS